MNATANPFVEFLARYGDAAGEDGPILFVREVCGAVPDPWQEQVLRAYGRRERRISIRSCHGPGKTACLAWCVLHQLLTRYPQKTVATAPTSAQIYDALFSEVVFWYKRLSPALQELLEVKSDRIELKAAPEASFFSARTSRAEKPEALQGVHSEHVLLIVDEASGVPEPIFEAAAGSMSGHRATTILASNPVRTSGFFFDTHHKLKDMWFTVHVSYEISSRVSRDYVEDMARRYGRDSNAFRVRCLGEFPRSDDDTVIPFELVEGARNRDIVVPPSLPRVWGLDVARFGDDANALCVRNRLAVIEMQKWSGVDTMVTTGRIKNKWDSTPSSERPAEILVDVIGLGAGVVDRLRELGLPARGINVSETASANEKYRNLRTELWFEAREWLKQANVVLPRGKDRESPEEILADELVIPKYTFTSSGKLMVESKADMKRRGYKSPNCADAFVISFAGQAATMVLGSSGGTRWSQPLKRGIRGVV